MDDALVDLDEVTNAAWRRFRHDLSDRMADLASGEMVEVTTESLGGELELRCAPRLEFHREAEVVVGRLTCDCPDPHQCLNTKARRRLRDIGWSKHRAPGGVVAFVTQADVAYVDQLAAMVVPALREVFGVTHLAFLAGDVGIGDDPYSSYAEVGCLDEPLAVTPRDREHLDELIDSALAPMIGHMPERDADGDIGVASGTAVVFVRAVPNGSIRVWAEVVVHVSEPDRARFEIDVLNRDHHFTKFQMIGDRIVADMYLLASPFVVSHLRNTVGLMCSLIDQVDDDLAVRVGGRRFVEPGDADFGDTEQDAEADDASDDATNDGEQGSVHLAMMTLLQLDADQPGSISPAMAAHICEYDKRQLLRLISSEEEQEIEWLKARDEARETDDSEELAEVCEDERQHAERTVSLLRKALRLVIDREMSEH